MTSERLRLAASRLREVSSKATPSPWKTWGMTLLSDPVGNSNVDDGIPVVQGLMPDGERRRTFNLSYIQAMQPVVALALADWLEATAERIDLRRNHGWRGTKHALAVADAILGGDF